MKTLALLATAVRGLSAQTGGPPEARASIRLFEAWIGGQMAYRGLPAIAAVSKFEYGARAGGGLGDAGLRGSGGGYPGGGSWPACARRTGADGESGYGAGWWTRYPGDVCGAPTGPDRTVSGDFHAPGWRRDRRPRGVGVGNSGTDQHRRGPFHPLARVTLPP